MITASNPEEQRSRPVICPRRQVINRSRPVIRVSRPVFSLPRPVERSSRPILLVSRPVEILSKPVASLSRPVERGFRPVFTDSRPVRDGRVGDATQGATPTVAFRSSQGDDRDDRQDDNPDHDNDWHNKTGVSPANLHLDLSGTSLCRDLTGIDLAIMVHSFDLFAMHL